RPGREAVGDRAAPRGRARTPGRRRGTRRRAERAKGARQRPSGRGAGTLRRNEGARKMAKKRLAAVVKIQITAGQATPAPPVGTALGPHGINIMDFCKAYNAATESQRGTVVPAEISIYGDRSFTFVTKTPPTPFLLRHAGGP